MRLGALRIECHEPASDLLGTQQALARAAIKFAAPARGKRPEVEFFFGRPLGDIALIDHQAGMGRCGDRPHHFVLDLEKVDEIAVVFFGPQMAAAARFDELCGYAHAASELADAAFEHIAHAQFLADAGNIDGAALIGENRVAGDDERVADPRNLGDQVFGDAVGEEFLLGVIAHVEKGQDGNRQSRLGREPCPPVDILDRGRRCPDLRHERKDADRLGDILEFAQSEIRERQPAICRRCRRERARKSRCRQAGRGFRDALRY